MLSREAITSRTSVTRARVKARESEARRALVLHDRPLVVDLIQLTRNHGLFLVDAARDLAEAEAVLARHRPHIAVIDMDHDDANELLIRLGASNTLRQSETPVLGLTRRGDLSTKLKAFDLGVDDILTLPFSPEELLARSIVISRRASGTDRPIVPTIRLGEMEIDIVHRQVRAGRSVVHLSGIEQSLVYLLASRGGQVVTREEILDGVWGPISWPRATSSIATSAACGSSSRTAIATRGPSRPFRDRGIGSSRRSRTADGPASRHPTELQLEITARNDGGARPLNSTETDAAPGCLDAASP
jgi:DNA-binding response OmpR family regulator